MHSMMQSTAKARGVVTSPVVLLVEPDPDLIDDRTTLLLRSGYLVVPARGVREICEIRSVEQIDIAVLRISDGASTLCCAAESVRRQWPTARILILGCAHNCLEDPLYDEALEAEFQPETFMQVLAKIMEHLQNQKRPLTVSNREEVVTANGDVSRRKPKATEIDTPRLLRYNSPKTQLSLLSASARR
jgi:DNA-binding NtrC family response regulator